MNNLTIFKELHNLNLKFKCNLQELQENDVLLTFHLHYEFPTISIHRFDRDCFIEEFEYLQNGIMYKIEEDFSKDEYTYFINKIEGIR